jgi:predicted acylesterase/phospholipase RssA
MCSKVEDVCITDISLSGILHHHGFIKNNTFIQHLKVLTLDKVGKESITFGELYEISKKELVVCAYNATKHETQYFSPILTPDMYCIEALRLSSAIPLVFSKQYFNGDLYLDGAIANPFPINQVYQPYTSNTKKGVTDTHILGLKIHKKPDVSDKNIIDYIMYIMELSDNIHNNTVMDLYNETDISSFNFSTKTTQKLLLFRNGQEIAKSETHNKKE